ncbi:nucleotidyl transferase AbiEii/AbiGii toxin family protein [Arachnia propionica]|uniref:nucleotidyl transferase AbiEii/AbiGii toxin family protein n=1 Tax=Arachnia propionica TaxID=1750 RepID=UPI001C8950BD|nr:nucleotidyl transferase AbiEii/AbiGii toxin family protein [Arachnia propionica]
MTDSVTPRTARDIDANAVGAEVSPEYLAHVLVDLARMSEEDGVEFDLGSMSVQEIREQGEHPGCRVRLRATIGPWQGVAAWDVTTGAPIIPPPRLVTIDRLLGDPFRVRGYAVEGIIAEKVVTIFGRGISSTRWRDLVDIVRLCERGFDSGELRRSVEKVAQFRGVLVGSVAETLKGYGMAGQRKWAAWRRKEGLEAVSQASLEDQAMLVAGFMDPILGKQA